MDKCQPPKNYLNVQIFLNLCYVDNIIHLRYNNVQP